MKKKIKVLIIEDEAAIRDMIQFSFPEDAFIMLEAENVTQAIRRFSGEIPDIVIVDWMLPGKSGIDFIKWIKQQESLKTIPVILLTAKAEEENKIKGLEIGADDYITKPFSPGELIARIKAVLRRGTLLSETGTIQVKNLSLDVNTQQVTIKGAVLTLTPSEYRLLYFFMTHPNKVYTRDQLLSLVWGGDVYVDERTVDGLIRRLRQQLRPYDYHHLVKTVRGSGYQFLRE